MTTTPRRALAAVGIQFFLNGFIYANVIARLPEIRDRVGISTGGLGIVLMLGSVSGVVGSVLTGPVIARVGTRRAMVGGSLLGIAGIPVIGFATNPAILLVGLITVLFFDVFADVAMNVQGSVLSADRETPVMNRLHGLWSLASVIGGLLAVAVASTGVVLPVHLVVVTIAMAVGECLLWPHLLAVDQNVSDTSDLPDGVDVGDDLSSRRRLAAPVHAALYLGLAGAAAMIMEVTAGDWAAVRLTDDLGAAAGLAAAAYVAFTLGMTAGRFGGDWVQVRVGVDRLMLATSILAAIGLSVASLASIEAIALVGFLVAGLGVSVQFPQLYDAAARLPGPPGSGFTAMLIGQRLAMVLTPLVIGMLATTEALDVGQAMAIVAVPAAVATLVLSLMRRAGR